MNNFYQQMLAGKIYAKTKKRKDNLLFAINGIKKMLEIAPNSYVSISFGKQSICLAHLVFKINPKIEMHFLASEETWYMYNFKEVIECFIKKWPINLIIHQTEHYFKSKTWKENRDRGDKDLQKMCSREDYNGVFIGLSKDESKARRITCSLNNTNFHESIFQYKDGFYRCTPLQNWSLLDIAAYLDENNIPILNIYKKFGLQMRTTARITKKARYYGAHTILKATNSKGFRILVDKHREIEQ